MTKAIQSCFRGFHAFTRERGFRERPDGYISKCHLCTDMRRHLALNGDFAELSPAEFYRHLE